MSQIELSDLDLSARIRNRLTRNEILTLERLQEFSFVDLKKGIFSGTDVARIEEELDRVGLSLRVEPGFPARSGRSSQSGIFSGRLSVSVPTKPGDEIYVTLDAGAMDPIAELDLRADMLQVFSDNETFEGPKYDQALRSTAQALRSLADELEARAIKVQIANVPE